MKRSASFAVLFFAALLVSGCAGARDSSASRAVVPASRGADAEQFEDLRLPEFHLGPGDRLEITVFRHDDLKRSMAVDLSGKIMFPLVGDLQASGKSVFALRDEITRKLSRFLVNPAVTIEVTEVLSRRIMVLGEVRSPGYFILETEVSALDALAKAGGADDDANLAKVLLMRRAGDKRTETYLDLRKALAGGDLAANVTLQNGDVVFVPSTRIANISRYASYLSNILSPIVALEGAIVLGPLVKDALKGESQGSQVSIPTSK